jgi:hypothetical protein
MMRPYPKFHGTDAELSSVRGNVGVLGSRVGVLGTPPQLHLPDLSHLL